MQNQERSCGKFRFSAYLDLVVTRHDEDARRLSKSPRQSSQKRTNSLRTTTFQKRRLPDMGSCTLVQRSPRCLIPSFDGALFSIEWRDALWDRFYTAAPRRQRQSVERYSVVKR